MSDIEPQDIPLVNEEEIFDKPDTKPKKKPKKVLSDAQKEGLAKGRAKVKANREAKLREKLEKEAKVKIEREGLVKAQKENTKQRETKKKLVSQQAETRQKIVNRNNKKKIDEFEKLKYSALEKLENTEHFDKLDKALTGYIKESDILDGTATKKVGELLVELRKKTIK